MVTLLDPSNNKDILYSNCHKKENLQFKLNMFCLPFFIFPLNKQNKDEKKRKVKT